MQTNMIFLYTDFLPNVISFFIIASYLFFFLSFINRSIVVRITGDMGTLSPFQHYEGEHCQGLKGGTIADI